MLVLQKLYYAMCKYKKKGMGYQQVAKLLFLLNWK